MLKNLGQRIRTIRKEKGLTLVEIAQKTGIAQATLSRIETGTMIGTVESHEKIAEILGIGLGELYSGIDRRYEEVTHLKAEDERKVTQHSKTISVELLTSHATAKKISPLLITFKTESKTTPEKLERGVEKFLYVLKGEILAKIEGTDYLLKSGETLYFDASLEHQFVNSKTTEAQLLVTVSPSMI